MGEKCNKSEGNRKSRFLHGVTIRAFSPGDLDWAKDIHYNQYRQDFEYPNFLDKYHYAFTVIDDKTDAIVTAGGIRPIAEIVALTDKDLPERVRVEALYKLLTAIKYAGNELKYDQLHAFIQDREFIHHLLKKDFRVTSGVALVHDI